MARPQPDQRVAHRSHRVMTAPYKASARTTVRSSTQPCAPAALATRTHRQNAPPHAGIQPLSPRPAPHAAITLLRRLSGRRLRVSAGSCQPSVKHRVAGGTQVESRGAADVLAKAPEDDGCVAENSGAADGPGPDEPRRAPCLGENRERCSAAKDATAATPEDAGRGPRWTAESFAPGCWEVDDSPAQRTRGDAVTGLWPRGFGLDAGVSSSQHARAHPSQPAKASVLGLRSGAFWPPQEKGAGLFREA